MLTEAVRVRDLDKYLGRKILLQFDQTNYEFNLHYTTHSWDYSSFYLFEIGRLDPICRLDANFYVSVLPEMVKIEEPKVEPKKEVEVTQEVFGRPIKGEIRPTSSEIPKQDDPAEVIEALDELLAQPGVIAYKWVQYTPYWMDGEPCEFYTLTDYNAGVKLEFGDPEGGEAGDGFYSLSDIRYDSTVNQQVFAELKDALTRVEAKINSSRNYVWLKETFGDHASVIATKEGFEVEYYEHD
jgi:hypothetical protein